MLYFFAMDILSEFFKNITDIYYTHIVANLLFLYNIATKLMKYIITVRACYQHQSMDLHYIHI